MDPGEEEDPAAILGVGIAQGLGGGRTGIVGVPRVDRLGSNSIVGRRGTTIVYSGDVGSSQTGSARDGDEAGVDRVGLVGLESHGCLVQLGG